MLNVDIPSFETNQSRLQFYLDCHRKYWWRFEENLVPDRPEWALEVGKALHVGTAVINSGGDITTAVQLSTKAFRDAMPERLIPGDVEIIEEHAQTIQRLLPAYIQHWKHDQTFKHLAVEVAGRVEIGSGTGVFLNFRVDSLAQAMRQLWIYDAKSMSKLDPRDLLKYEMDLQFTAYIYAVSKQLGTRVSGVLVDALVKTKIPQFHREFFTRSDEELQEFEYEFVEMCQEIARGRARIQQGEDPKVVFYKNTRECFRYGTCAYRPLCLLDTPERRMAFISRKPDYVDQSQDASRTPAHQTRS